MHNISKITELIHQIETENPVSKWTILNNPWQKNWYWKSKIIKVLVAFLLGVLLNYLSTKFSNVNILLKGFVLYFISAYIVDFVKFAWFTKKDVKPSNKTLINLIKDKIDNIDDDQNRWIKVLKTIRLCPELVQMEIYDNEETILAEIKKTQDDIWIHKYAIEYLNEKKEEADPGSGFTKS